MIPALFSPFRGARVVLSLGTLLALTTRGCPNGGPKTPVARDAQPAPGVKIRQMKQGASYVRVIDVDLGQPGVRLQVAADEIALRQGLVTGRARTLPDWLERTGAVAGINGGFFGKSLEPDFKEIVGLLKMDGRVRKAGPVYHARPQGTRYSRCAFGQTRRGELRMSWVTSRPGDPQALFAHAQPELAGRGEAWEVEQALACGPRLVREGKVEITQRGERLASPGALPRTFLGFGGPNPRKPRVVLCAAEGMEFEECAQFLTSYFRSSYGTPCREGMCLDGGASTQAAWREGGKVVSDLPFSTTVPTALLVHGK